MNLHLLNSTACSFIALKGNGDKRGMRFLLYQQSPSCHLPVAIPNKAAARA
jgi:hypothetical protein